MESKKDWSLRKRKQVQRRSSHLRRGKEGHEKYRQNEEENRKKKSVRQEREVVKTRGRDRRNKRKKEGKKSEVQGTEKT